MSDLLATIATPDQLLNVGGLEIPWPHDYVDIFATGMTVHGRDGEPDFEKIGNLWLPSPDREWDGNKDLKSSIEFVGRGDTDDKARTVNIQGYLAPHPYLGGAYVYAHRWVDTGEILQLQMAFHDGLSQEMLDRENEEAQIHPDGWLAYWYEKEFVSGNMTADQFREMYINEEVAEGLDPEYVKRWTP
jgi:hypothetical protein